MKTILVIAALSLALPVYASVYTGNSDYTSPYASDAYTMGLWHFDEVSGDTLVADASGNSPDGTLSVLDATKTWKTSMSGFGNMASTWFRIRQYGLNLVHLRFRL